MTDRQIYDHQLHAQFLTFTCYRRRRVLDTDASKQIVLKILGDELQARDGVCCGYVVMPNHLHAIVWFPQTDQLSGFMRTWKTRTSKKLKLLLRGQSKNYAKSININDPIWQAKYFSLNLFTASIAKVKLDYMHMNPVRAKLVQNACDWEWSSVRYFERGQSSDLPMSWIFD